MCWPGGGRPKRIQYDISRDSGRRAGHAAKTAVHEVRGSIEVQPFGAGKTGPRIPRPSYEGGVCRWLQPRKTGTARFEVTSVFVTWCGTIGRRHSAAVIAGPEAIETAGSVARQPTRRRGDCFDSIRRHRRVEATSGDFFRSAPGVNGHRRCSTASHGTLKKGVFR